MEIRRQPCLVTCVQWCYWKKTYLSNSESLLFVSYWSYSKSLLCVSRCSTREAKSHFQCHLYSNYSGNKTISCLTTFVQWFHWKKTYWSNSESLLCALCLLPSKSLSWVFCWTTREARSHVWFNFFDFLGWLLRLRFDFFVLTSMILFFWSPLFCRSLLAIGCTWIAYCIWSVTRFVSLKSQSIILFFRSRLPRSVEKRPMSLRLKIEIEWHCKCNGLISVEMRQHIFMWTPGLFISQRVSLLMVSFVKTRWRRSYVVSFVRYLCCSVLHCVTARCNVLQVCCSVLYVYVYIDI